MSALDKAELCSAITSTLAVSVVGRMARRCLGRELFPSCLPIYDRYGRAFAVFRRFTGSSSPS